jgi:hypothetical protein
MQELSSPLTFLKWTLQQWSGLLDWVSIGRVGLASRACVESMHAKCMAKNIVGCSWGPRVMHLLMQYDCKCL